MTGEADIELRKKLWELVEEARGNGIQGEAISHALAGTMYRLKAEEYRT